MGLHRKFSRSTSFVITDLPDQMRSNKLETVRILDKKNIGPQSEFTGPTFFVNIISHYLFINADLIYFIWKLIIIVVDQLLSKLPTCRN